MAVDLIGVNGMAAELKQTYSRIMLNVLEKNLVFANYGKQYNIPARGGKSIEMRRFLRMPTAAALTEGTMPTVTLGTYATVSATISQYGAYTQISDLLEVQGFDNVIDDYSQEFGRQAAETLDTVIRDVVTATTTLQYAGDSARVGTSGTGATGSGNYLNGAELLEAKRTLARGDVKPLNGKFVCILHPDNTKDLFQDTDIVNAFKDSADRGVSNPLSTGVLGDWMGIRFVETTNLLVRSSYGMSGADVYEVLLFGEEAYGLTKLDAMQMQMIIHPRGQGGHTDPLDQYSTLGWKAALAAKILDVNRIVKIYVASSRTPAA